MASCSRNLIFFWCLFAQLVAFPGCVSAEIIRVQVGADVTLPCRYSRRYGPLWMCWGRGSVPFRGCSNQILKGDGMSTVWRSSMRYQLWGKLNDGDASLTIRQAQEKDSGVYGCRVEIPGLFNDIKHEVTLMVVPGRPNPLKVQLKEIMERTLTVRWDHVFDGGRPITTYRVHWKENQQSWHTAKAIELYNPQLTQVTLMDLRPAKTYNLRMFAMNSMGLSDTSNVLTVTTKEAAPDGPPIDIQIQALTSRSIEVTWRPPRADVRNGVVRSYSLSYREHDSAGRPLEKWEHQSITATWEVETLVLTNLKPSTKYGVTIQAKTNAGVGPAATAPLCTTLDEERPTSTAATPETSSSPVTVWNTDSSLTAAAENVTGETTTASATVWEEEATNVTSGSPDPPVIELKEVKGFTISVLWTPGFEGDSPITGYYLEYKALNASWDSTSSDADFSANQTEATIIEMIPLTYNIRMFAQNSLGRSKASNVLTFTVNETGHEEANLTTTTSTDTHASLSFEEDQSSHLVTIVVPVVLVVLIVALVTAWQLRRMKRKKGSLNMWLSNGTVQYTEADHDYDEDNESL